MLRLLSLLQAHRYWPGAELAGRLEVSERTLRRDVERLRDLGYQVDSVRGVAGGYQLRAGGQLPPLLLEDEEAVAVAVGLRTAAAGAVGGTGDWSVQALTKVVALMPPRLRRQMDALTSQTQMPGPWEGGTMVDAGVLTGLAQACRDHEAVRFDYTARSAATGGASGSTPAEPSTRHVEPHGLVVLGRRWYLVAYDRDRQDWRSFRLDRMAAAPRPTGQRFRPRDLPADDALTFVRAGIRQMPQRYAVRVRFAAPPSAIAAVTDQWATVVPDGDGCLMEMATDSLGWPLMVLGESGAEFEVESPPELVAAVREVADRFGRAGTATR